MGCAPRSYSSRIAATGRMFVTMFGYPSNCENMGGSHPCTLSFACWLVGGSSQPGCGANSWIVSCCVLSKTKALTEFQDIDDEVEELESREGTMPLLQKRADDYEDRDNEECGITADRLFSKRIIGGKKALFGQYPWQAYIKIATYQCGGVLGSRKFVATAAHCIINARLKDILVYLGELDTQDTGDVEELAPAELHRGEERIIHPKFRYRVTQPDLYDLSLLELLTEAGRAFHIIPICLPESSIDLTGKSGVGCWMGKGAAFKRALRNQCPEERFRTSTRHSGMHEMAYPEKDLSGPTQRHAVRRSPRWKVRRMFRGLRRPLVVQEKGRWTLVGITSAGFGCGRASSTWYLSPCPCDRRLDQSCDKQKTVWSYSDIVWRLACFGIILLQRLF
nr:unnamed protein product [Callosobruchus chinensis]